MTDDAEQWTPDPAEVLYLTQFAGERHCILAIGDADGIESWKVAAAAGFSGGKTRDELRRRENLRSAFSRATRHRKQTLPHIRALKEKLKDFRRGVNEPRSLTHKQMLERLDFLIMHGEATQSIQAIKVKDAMTGKNHGEVTPEQIIAQLIGKVGAEQAKRGMALLGCEHLVNRAPHLFDTEARIARLEAEHERKQTGPSGDGAPRPDVRGRDGVRAAVTPEVGARCADAGGVAGNSLRRERDGPQRRPHPATTAPAAELDSVSGRPRPVEFPEPSREQQELAAGFLRHIGLGSKE